MRCENTSKKVVKKSGCKLPQQSSATKRRATDVTKSVLFLGGGEFFTKHVLVISNYCFMAFNNMMSVYVLVALLSSLPLRLIGNND